MSAKIVMIVCMALFAVSFALPAAPETVATNGAAPMKPMMGMQPKENMKTAEASYHYGYYPSYGYPSYYSGLGYRSVGYPYYGYNQYYNGYYNEYPAYVL